MPGYENLSDAELDARIAAMKAQLGVPPPGTTPGTALAPPAATPQAAVNAAPQAAPAAPSPYAGMTDTELDARLAELRRQANETPTVQEMHPAFTEADRLIVKNFAANNEAAVNYLQRKHPNLEISVDDATGQIKARARNGSEKEYRVLDPDQGVMGTFTSLKGLGEGLRDLGDIGYDVASGIGTGTATAAAGLAGAAAGGVGALPAAMGAGAASSTGLEGLRQALGRALGIEGNFDPTSLAAAGIAGAASPLLFGTGGQVTSALGKKVLGSGLDDATLASIQSAQRGAIGRGWDAYGKPALAKLGSMASGASSDSLMTLGKNYDKIKALEKDPEAITNFTREAAQNVGSRLKAAKTQAWDAYEAALGTAQADGEKVTISGVAAPLKEAMAEAKAVAGETKTKASRGLYNDLRREFQRLFTYTERQPILDDAGVQMVDEVTGDPLFRTVRKEITELSPQAATRLEQALGDLGQLQKLKPDRMGVGNRFGATQTADDKMIAQIGVEMKKILGKNVEDTLGPDALAARGAYGQIANLEKRTTPLLKNPAKAFSTLRNADKTANTTTAELFNRLDTQFGSDLINRAKIMDAYATFAKPSAVPLSAGGATSTSRSIPLGVIGGGLGYWAGSSQGGEGRGSGVLGGLAGGALGGFLGSPAMMRRLIAAGIKGGQLNQALGPLRPGIGGQLLQSPWLGIENQP